MNNILVFRLEDADGKTYGESWECYGKCNDPNRAIHGDGKAEGRTIEKLLQEAEKES